MNCVRCALYFCVLCVSVSYALLSAMSVISTKTPRCSGLGQFSRLFFLLNLGSCSAPIIIVLAGLTEVVFHVVLT